MKKIFLAVVLASMLFFSATSVNALSTQDLQAQIQALMTQIATLQAQLKQMQGNSTAWCHTFNTNLRIGDNNKQEIVYLEEALGREAVYTNSEDRGGWIGNFDERVASAVTAFQEKYASEVLTPNRLKSGTGYAGPGTRAKLNALYGCGTTPPDVKCVDSDGGLDYYVQGQAKIPVYGPGSNPQFLDDSCQGNTLTEAICNASGHIDSVTYTCSNGCSNGACKPDSTQPSITVTSPNGGEVFEIGKTYTLNWTSTGLNNSLMHLYVISSDGTMQNDIAGGAPNTGSYTWTVPQNQLQGAHRFYVSAGEVSDHSNNVFSIWKTTITQPTVLYKTDFDGGTLYDSLSRSYDGGNIWKVIFRQYKGKVVYATTLQNVGIIYAGGTSCNTMADTSKGCVDLYKSTDRGENWVNISKGITDKIGVIYGVSSISVDSDNLNIVNVIVNSATASNLNFKSVDSGNTWSQQSTQPSITVTSPNGGDVWNVGGTYNITWTSKGLDQNLPVGITIADYSSNGRQYDITPFNHYYATAHSPLVSDGQYSIKLGSDFTSSVPSGSKFVIYVATMKDSHAIIGGSNGYFSIVAP